MKTKIQENRIHKSGKISINAIAILSLVCLAVSQLGCGQNQIQNQGMNQIQQEAYRIIGNALMFNDPVIRINAIEIAATTGQVNFMPTISGLLTDSYVPVRYAAALAVGDMKYTPAVNTINQLLRDNDPNVIIAASYAMVKFGYPEYIEVLRDSVKNNENPIITANAALLLGKSGDRNSIPLLRQLMTDPTSSDMTTSSRMIGVGYQAAEALAMLGDVTIFEKLWAMLYNTYADVRITGMRAMGTLGTQQAQNALLPLLEDEITEIRLVAAEQLGKMNNHSGQDVVLEVFKKNLNINFDTQASDRINILTALAIGEIGTSSLTKYLPELMENDSIFVRLAAAKAVFLNSQR